MSNDPDYRRLINSVRWLRLRRDVLTATPLCERCTREGFVTAATEVHHRRPVETGLNFNEKRRLMYDPSNLMALCHGCHVAIHTEMGRSGRDVSRRRTAAQVASIIADLFGDDAPDG